MRRKQIDFIIIGAQKSGTTAAAFNLDKHPDISLFNGKTEYGQYELEFFNQHWDRGVDWYFQHIPQTGCIRGEKTAELLHRTICHKRIFETQPDVKLILLLRNPIERAYSQWRMAYLHKKDETRTFDEVVKDEITLLNNSDYKNSFNNCLKSKISCWREGYILKGFYYSQIQSLLTFFSREQLHIAISEQVQRNKQQEYNNIFSFLGVRQYFSLFEDKFIGKPAAKMSPHSLQKLKAIYEEDTEKLFDFLGLRIKEWID